MSASLGIGLAALLTAAIMATNLWAVVRDRRDVERITKPTAMLALLAVAALAGAGAVAAYMLVIGAMAVTGWATVLLLVGLGVSLFVVSDTVLALGRFVEPRSWTRPVTMLTYHGAQALIVAGLLT